MRKIINLIFIFTIIMFFVFSFFKGLLQPQEINRIENKYANKINLFDFKGYLDNSYQDNLSKSLNDQVYGSENFKWIQKRLEYDFIDLFRKHFKDDFYNMYVKYSNINFYKGNHLMYRPDDFSYIKERVDNRIKNINRNVKESKDVKFYLYLIENDISMNYETLLSSPIYDYLKENIVSDRIKIKKFDNSKFEVFQKNFFLSDHHWNCEGSYRAYKDLLKFLDLNDNPFPYEKKIKLSDNFTGSKTLRLLKKDEFKEDFYVYGFNFPAREIIINGKKEEKYSFLDVSDISKISDVNYGSINGADQPELLIRNNNTDGENILILGDSFDNAITDLLSLSFKNLYSVDLRYYEDFYKEKFRISDYIEKNKIDKVLYIGQAYFYISPVFSTYYDN